MNFISGLFRNPVEKAFNLSSLQVQLNHPIQAAYSSYYATYNGLPSQILLYPSTTLEAAFLIKHQNMLRIHSFATYVDNSVTRKAVLTDPIEPISSPPMYLIALKAVLQVFELLQQEHLRLQRFSTSAMALQSGIPVFVELDAIQQGEFDFSVIYEQFSRAFSCTLEFGVHFSRKIDKMLQQECLQSDVFEIIENFQLQYKDVTFLQKIIDFARASNKELVAEILLPLVFKQLQVDFSVNLHKVACLLASLAVENLSVDEFALLVAKSIELPECASNFNYFSAFTQLRSGTEGDEYKIIAFVLQKQPTSDSIAKLAETLSLMLRENCLVICQSIGIFEPFYESLSKTLLSYQKKKSNLTSWNIYCALSELLRTGIEMKQKMPNFDAIQQDREKLARIGLLPERFIEYFLSPALISISQCYDSIEALLCCNYCIEQMSSQEKMLLYTAMSSEHGLLCGLYSKKKGQRELALSVRSSIDACIWEDVSVASEVESISGQSQAKSEPEPVVREKPVVSKPESKNEWGDSSSSESEEICQNKTRKEELSSSDSLSSGQLAQKQESLNQKNSFRKGKVVSKGEIKEALTDSQKEGTRASEAEPHCEQEQKQERADTGNRKKTGFDDSSSEEEDVKAKESAKNAENSGSESSSWGSSDGAEKRKVKVLKKAGAKKKSAWSDSE